MECDGSPERVRVEDLPPESAQRMNAKDARWDWDEQRVLAYTAGVLVGIHQETMRQLREDLG
jgi:hypothetical protein